MKKEKFTEECPNGPDTLSAMIDIECTTAVSIRRMADEGIMIGSPGDINSQKSISFRVFRTKQGGTREELTNFTTDPTTNTITINE